MSKKKLLEAGLYRKPCGCLVVVDPFGYYLMENRCEAEGQRMVSAAALVPVPDEDEETAIKAQRFAGEGRG